MYQDFIIEKIVKRMRKPKDVFLTVLLIISATSFILFLILLPLVFELFLAVLSLILIPLVIYLLYRLITGMNKEYEYSLTNDMITIDRIVAKKRRKSLYNGSIKDFQLVASLDGDEFDQYLEQNCLRLDVRSGEPDKEDWFIVTKHEGSTLLILFEIDDRIKEHIRRYNPRSIRRK
jgi:hypothetical protein